MVFTEVSSLALAVSRASAFVTRISFWNSHSYPSSLVDRLPLCTLSSMIFLCWQCFTNILIINFHLKKTIWTSVLWYMLMPWAIAVKVAFFTLVLITSMKLQFCSQTTDTQNKFKIQTAQAENTPQNFGSGTYKSVFTLVPTTVTLPRYSIRAPSMNEA